MINLIAQLFKNSPIKSISITSLFLLVVFGAAVIKAGDYRYCLASVAQQQQRYMISDMEDKLLIIDLKKKGLTEEQN